MVFVGVGIIGLLIVNLLLLNVNFTAKMIIGLVSIWNFIWELPTYLVLKTVSLFIKDKK